MVVGLLMHSSSALWSICCSFCVDDGVNMVMFGILVSSVRLYMLWWLGLLLLVMLVWLRVNMIGRWCSVMSYMIWFYVWFRNVE